MSLRIVPIEEAKRGDMVEVEVGTPWPRDAKTERVTGKVVRVQKSGVLTVDVEKTRANPGGHSNADVGYVDILRKKNACVGCGYCCQRAPCALSVATYGQQANCPALRFTASGYRCGMVEDAQGGQRERIERELAIGAGCCSPLFNSVRSAAIAKAARQGG